MIRTVQIKCNRNLLSQEQNQDNYKTSGATEMFFVWSVFWQIRPKKLT